MLENKELEKELRSHTPINLRSLKKILAKDPEWQDHLLNTLGHTYYDLVYFVNNNESIYQEGHKCPFCGVRIHYNVANRKMNIICNNRECKSKQSKLFYESLSEEQKFNRAKKINKTLKERYGDDYIKARTEKAKQTNLERYGCTCTFQLDAVKEKIKETNNRKYGCDNAACSDIVKEKAKQTNLERYGVTSTALVARVRQKQIETTLKRFGTANAMCSPIVKNRLARTRHDITYDKILEKCKEQGNIVVPLFTKEEFEGSKYSYVYPWKCNECGETFSFYYNNGVIPVCRHCHPKKFGAQQNELLEYIKSIYSGEILTNSRSIISPLELDIYIPELKLAIEYNGNYWHSSEQKDKSYHLRKTEMCEAKGISLIHIFEYEWNNIELRNIIKQRLTYRINYDAEKIFARKCVVKPITVSDSNIFIDKHHLQGSISAKINLGLFHQDELVAVMSFGKPRFNKNYEWELLRFCSGHQVIGGASKLLKYFEKNYNPKSLISYANRNWSGINSVYTKLNFELIGHTKPNYVYVNKDIILKRYQTQKHKLKELLGEENFNEKLSETENMKNNGFIQVFDCGNMVFAKTYNTNV